MLQKRIIGVIAVDQGLAVQSFGYKRTLPLGKPEYLAENLDRWGADEIMILDFSRSRKGLGPDMDLIHRLGNLSLGTPLSYGGGVTTAAQAVAIIQAGVERICLDSLLQDNRQEVITMAEQMGAQALIATFPLSVADHKLQRYEHRHGSINELDEAVIELLVDGYLSEALVVDWEHEGARAGFNRKLIEMFSKKAEGIPLLLYGGISEADQLRDFLDHPAVSAICIGNFLNYREHAFQALKKELGSAIVRPPFYLRTLS